MKQFFSAIAICLLFSVKAFSFTKIVTVSNHVFTPSSFTINLGDTVKWTWVEGSHTTTSLTIPAGAAAWNHNINSGSQSFIYVPTVTGLYNYKCTPHQAMGMVGNFTVSANCATPTVQISASSSTTFCEGSSVLLTSTTSTNITAFQWKKNGSNIANAKSSTFTATTTGSYTLMVTNNCGKSATSNAVNVTANNLPKATITPADSTNVCSGDSVKLTANSGSSFTYQWSRNGTNIAGAAKRSFFAKKAGNYKVTVTNSTTGCSQTSATTKVKVIKNCLNSITATWLPADIGKTIKIFPNPSSDNFHVTLPSYADDQYSLTIFDANARLISNSKIVSKDFSFGNELKQGIYLIQVKKNNAVIFEEKIIKNK